jgi:ribosome maturation factor RimP
MGRRPIFCFAEMHKAPQPLTDLIRRALDALGYELVGVEYLARPKAGHLLRVYIDSEDGIGLDDCERASHQISGVLDVEDPIRGDYALEVSSPGLDRPLFELAHFARFAGETARVRLHGALEGRSNFKGTILQVDGADVVLDVDGVPVRLPFAQIASARLVPQF